MGTLFHPSDTLASWGRVVKASHLVARPRFTDEIGALVASFSKDEPGLGDWLEALLRRQQFEPGGRVIDMTALDRLIAFDRETGVMRAEAGVSLSQALQVLVRRGLVPANDAWFALRDAWRRCRQRRARQEPSCGGNIRRVGHAAEAAPHRWQRARAGAGRSTVSRHRRRPWPHRRHRVGGVPRGPKITSSDLDAQDFAFEHVSEYFDMPRPKRRTSTSTRWRGSTASPAGRASAAGSCRRPTGRPHGELKPHQGRAPQEDADGCARVSRSTR